MRAPLPAVLPLALLRRGPTLAALAESLPNRFRLIDGAGAVDGATVRQRVRDLAAAWAALGMGPRQRWGVLAEGRPAVLGMLAAATTGADVIMLDPHTPPLLLCSTISQNAVDGLILAEPRRDLAEPCRDLGVRHVLIDSRSPSGQGVPRVRGGRCLLQSSGTSGPPSVSGRARYGARALGPALDLARHLGSLRSPLLLTAPLHHGYGLGVLTLALLTGTPVVLGQRAQPDALLGLLRDHRVRTLVTVPPTLQRLVEHPDLGQTSLTSILTGSGPLSPALAAAVMDACGDIMHNLYGSTEAGWSFLATPADLRAAPGTVGRPVWGCRVRIINGEVFLSSPLATHAQTIFVPTGDLGRLDARGRLFLAGRRDNIVVVGGVNVDLTVVEEQLRGHPGVRDVLVRPVSDPGHCHRLTAEVVSDTSLLGIDELTRFAAARLPAAAVPRSWSFVEAVDRTPFGAARRQVR